MDCKFDVLEYVQRYIDKQNVIYGTTYKLYDPPVWEHLVKSETKAYLSYEDVPEMTFIYFTVSTGVESEGYKKYYQLVVGYFGIEIYYQDENVISINQNYPLSNVRIKFTNRCLHMLRKLGVDDIS